MQIADQEAGWRAPMRANRLLPVALQPARSRPKHNMTTKSTSISLHQDAQRIRQAVGYIEQIYRNIRNRPSPAGVPEKD